jgi:lipoprotein-anchoring transpeptidase ErfK/SrfK
MPFAVFFTGGYAIHATDAVARLGQPASHGCIRLAPQNAAMFFELVKIYGKSNTKIVVTP